MSFYLIVPIQKGQEKTGKNGMAREGMTKRSGLYCKNGAALVNSTLLQEHQRSEW